jgi:hypothetical protein
LSGTVQVDVTAKPSAAAGITRGLGPGNDDCFRPSENGALEFVVGGIHRGCEKALTYREALKLLKERGDFCEPPKFKVTQKLKALLVATTSIQENRGPSHGWGHGRFPVRFTKYQVGPETFTQYYYRGHRMREGLSVTNLQDIYRATYRIPLVVGTAILRMDRT